MSITRSAIVYWVCVRREIHVDDIAHVVNTICAEGRNTYEFTSTCPTHGPRRRTRCLLTVVIRSNAPGLAHKYERTLGM